MQLNILLLAKALAQIHYDVIIWFQKYKEHFSKGFSMLFISSSMEFIFFFITLHSDSILMSTSYP